MTDDPTINRRRLLELTSVGTGMAVAGCMNQVNDGQSSENGTDESGSSENGSDGNRRQVTMSVQIDQQEIQTRQQELLQEVQAGNTTQQEAQEEIQSLQEAAVEEALASAESEFESSNLTIEEQIASQGVLLVSGSEGDILDILETDVIQAIAASSLFEQAQTVQQQQQQQSESAQSQSPQS